MKIAFKLSGANKTGVDLFFAGWFNQGIWNHKSDLNLAIEIRLIWKLTIFELLLPSIYESG